MDERRYNWNQLSIELSKYIHGATDEELWKIIHKVQNELLSRNSIDWRLYG